MIDLLEQYKDIVIAISSIGTFISAMIAVFTLNEVKKQRLSLYQPDLLLKSFLVSISKSPLQKNTAELLEYKVCNFNDYSANYNQVAFDISPNYKVENLGFGVAKNVKCQWEFDTKKAISLIEKLLPQEYQFSWHKNLNLYILNQLNNDDFFYSANAEIDSHEIDYISPVNIQEHFHYHSIPEIIIFTHYLFLLFKNDLKSNSGPSLHIFEFSDFKFPKPALLVEYRDLNGKKYKKKYSFKMVAVPTQIEQVIDLEKEFAYLQFELVQQ